MPRASWRGFLRLSLVSCPIYLSPAATRTKPIRLHQVWQPAPADVDEDDLPDRSGGQRGSERSVTRLRADSAAPDGEQSPSATRITLRPHDPGTGEEIEKREVVKGYEYSRGQFLTFTDEELKALDVESSKVVDLEKFVAGSAGLFRQPVLRLSRWSDRGRGAPGDRRGNGPGWCRRSRAPYPQPARADGHGRAARYRDGAVYVARCRRSSGTTIRRRRGRSRKPAFERSYRTRALLPARDPDLPA